MGDQRDALRETLTRLHEQLGSADAIDEDLRGQLRDTLDEIRTMLDREPGSDSGEGSFSERLSDLTQDFEESHPTLAEAMGRVADALAKLGI